MAIRVERIEQRLKEMDEALNELYKYRSVTPNDLMSDLSLRWILEKGIIAGASSVFDVSDHILSSNFGFYANTYDESLLGLFNKGVISEALFLRIRGLGAFRNALIHRYLEIPPGLLIDNYYKSMRVFPQFAAEILHWLETMGLDGQAHQRP